MSDRIEVHASAGGWGLVIDTETGSVNRFKLEYYPLFYKEAAKEERRVLAA